MSSPPIEDFLATILLTTLCIYATNCIAKCVHPHHVVIIINKNLLVLAWHWLY